MNQLEPHHDSIGRYYDQIHEAIRLDAEDPRDGIIFAAGISQQEIAGARIGGIVTTIDQVMLREEGQCLLRVVASAHCITLNQGNTRLEYIYLAEPVQIYFCPPGALGDFKWSLARHYLTDVHKRPGVLKAEGWTGEKYLLRQGL